MVMLSGTHRLWVLLLRTRLRTANHNAGGCIAAFYAQVFQLIIRQGSLVSTIHDRRYEPSLQLATLISKWLFSLRQ